MLCPYEGHFKVVSADAEYVTRPYCQAHAEDWKKRRGGRIVQPRILAPIPIHCEADWPLPSEVP